MREDKYLKVYRPTKRRTLAHEACDDGRGPTTGRTVKAGAEVRPGDILSVAFGERTLTVEVVSVDEHAAKADAPAMYREI